MDFKDVHVMDVLTDGAGEFTVVSMDITNDVIEAQATAGYTVKATARQWGLMGYSVKGAAGAVATLAAAINAAAKQQSQSFYGPGLAGWLPQQAQQQQQPNGTWYNATQPVIQTVIKIDPPAPAKTRKQVSHNGKDWVDYRHLLDADDFDTYTHRREI